MITVFPSEIQDLVWARANVLACLSDDTGIIVFANDNLTSLYGYLPGELITKSIDDLVPVEVRSRHREYRTRFNLNPQERAMGERLPLQGQRKDGSLFSVRIQLIPCVVRGTPLTIANVYLMTDRLSSHD